MKNKHVQQLARCLDWIASGMLDWEDCIRQYPEIADDLRLASLLRSDFDKNLDSLSEARARRFVKAKVMSSLPNRDLNVTYSRESRYIGQKLQRRFAMSWIIIVTTLISLISGGGVVYASGNTLPGDTLYPVKTWVEDVRLAIASDEMDAGLHFQFAQTRLEEILSLSEDGDMEAIEEALTGYENQVELMTQSLEKIHSQDPDDAIRLRSDLQSKLQEQVRLMENWAESLDEMETPLQDRVREMLQTNTLLRERVNAVDDEADVENLERTDLTADPDIQDESVGTSGNNGANSSISAGIDPSANAFAFNLNGQGKNGVYAMVSGARYECTLDGDEAVCPAFGAPNSGNVQLFDQQTNKLLFTYTYAYEFQFNYDHSWQGEKNDSENIEGKNGSDSGGKGAGGNGGN